MKSVKGEGTTAELWLPHSQIALQEAEAPEQAPQEQNLPPLTILAGDDDPPVLMTRFSSLKILGTGRYRLINPNPMSILMLLTVVKDSKGRIAFLLPLHRRNNLCSVVRWTFCSHWAVLPGS